MKGKAGKGQRYVLSGMQIRERRRQPAYRVSLTDERSRWFTQEQVEEAMRRGNQGNEEHAGDTERADDEHAGRDV